jgi:hypothetical protein
MPHAPAAHGDSEEGPRRSSCSPRADEDCLKSTVVLKNARASPVIFDSSRSANRRSWVARANGKASNVGRSVEVYGLGVLSAGSTGLAAQAREGSLGDG